jgi:hypothetical protein
MTPLDLTKRLIFIADLKVVAADLEFGTITVKLPGGVEGVVIGSTLREVVKWLKI